MQPAVDIAVEPARRLLRLRFRGLMTEESLDRFERDLDVERRTLAVRGMSSNWPSVLIDARNSGVQTREAADRLRARMVAFHAPDRRIAFVVPDGSVLRMQLNRLAGGERCAFFADETDALRWLAVGHDAAA